MYFVAFWYFQSDGVHRLGGSPRSTFWTAISNRWGLRDVDGLGGLEVARQEAMNIRVHPEAIAGIPHKPGRAVRAP
jgi:hypothetical protein